MLNRPKSESHLLAAPPGVPDLMHLDATELQIQLRLTNQRAAHLRMLMEEEEKHIFNLRGLMARLGNKDEQ